MSLSIQWAIFSELAAALKRYTGTAPLTTEPLRPQAVSDPSEATKTSLHRYSLHRGSREILILELPRVDQNSLAALREALDQFQPQAVGVELDPQRFDWLSDRQTWEKLNLHDILREKKGRVLGSYLALRILQKRFGSFDQAEPGDEMCTAAEFARQQHLPIHLLDRDMKTTGLRAWRLTPFFARTKLSLTMATGPFRRTRTRQDAESPAAREDRVQRLRTTMPAAARAFIDERNLHIAQAVAATDEDRIALVLSPLHAAPVAELLAGPDLGDAGPDPDLLYVPPRTLISRAVPWLFTAFIIGLFLSLLFTGESQNVQGALTAWFLINAISTALVTALSLAHPATILAASISAPFVSLNPAIGAGTVGVLIQAFLRPPTIVDIERVGDDIIHLKGWWTNELARLLMIFVLANGGSTIGTFIALATFPTILG